MIISIFIYTRNEDYAIEKTKEVLSALKITDVVSISSEPYWKFDDVTVTAIQTLKNDFPIQEALDSVAKVWWNCGDDNIGTSDTTPNNTIYISDIEMIDLYILD